MPVSSPPASAGREEEPIDGELLDTAECSAYPNLGRCTHVRCILRERNRLHADLTSSRSESSRLTASLADLQWWHDHYRQAAENATRESSRLREALRDIATNYDCDEPTSHHNPLHCRACTAEAALSPQPKEGA